ncbi:MAG: exopolyphosphatase [Burkholderiales bacterium]|jgi:exopolyphosphatase/guanosine-5'-triphosphate,3'-diphosphate pyrophosphatase|nr:exopolyphosphatase [Burkholderiales bacterium]
MSYADGLLATVDLGSNSFRLLIAQIREDGSLHPIDQIKEIVRLTGGLDENEKLSPEKQAAALAVLARFSERLAGFEKNQVRVVGTSALRVAKNAEDFIVIANKTLGFDIEVISGTEEARLIYIGAMHSMSFTMDKRLVIDIGGGSTEFVTGVGYEPEIMESVTMGCVSFSNRYFAGGELNESNFANAIFAARSRVQAMGYLFASHDWSTVVGTSGTARALYDLCIENGFSDQISLDGLYKLRKLLIRHKNINNLPIVGLKDDRAPVIAGGLAIMTGLMEELSIQTMTIADGSLREGVMYDLLGRKTNCDLRESTIGRLKKRSTLDVVQGDRVARVVLELYHQIVDKTKQDPEQTKLLQWAAQVYETGLVISHNDYHKHGAYILANAELAGFSRPEQTLLADLVRAHRGGLTKAIDGLKNKRRVKSKLLMMILCFRLSVIFNRNRKDILKDHIIKVDNPTKEGFNLIIDGKWLKQNPLTRHSLNEEIGEWKKLDFKIKLVSP